MYSLRKNYGKPRQKNQSSEINSSPYFSSGIVERASVEITRLAFLVCGGFNERLRFARSTVPEEKWGLLVV